MKYAQANLGRVFVVLIEDGEDILEQLKNIIKKENIKAGFVHLIGASSNSKVVLGPVKKEYPPNPFWWEFDDAREILGLGIFAWENDEPKIHLHAGIGHNTESKVGCIREKSKVYITIEVIIQEITSSNVVRELDSRYNASLLKFE
ncbi:MAG: hypothetical protein A2287_01100 [Candidatus Melainabacteria bacterium RIFOXYA12_FULL_32_12]|nr:MAG: hypothetical protein A2287_01100 [Candidatus Melainabacteria bacterium RIFOXYA12_FULL_32_12]